MVELQVFGIGATAIRVGRIGATKVSTPAKRTSIVFLALEKLCLQMKPKTRCLRLNWEKYWSFDHICPCSLARDEEEMILLQHWSNWRPMVHLENLSKQDSITDDAARLCRILLKREP